MPECGQGVQGWGQYAHVPGPFPRLVANRLTSLPAPLPHPDSQNPEEGVGAGAGAGSPPRALIARCPAPMAPRSETLHVALPLVELGVIGTPRARAD